MDVIKWKIEQKVKLHKLESIPEHLFKEVYRLLEQMDAAYNDDCGSVDMILLDSSMAKIEGILETAEYYHNKYHNAELTNVLKDLLTSPYKRGA